MLCNEHAKVAALTTESQCLAQSFSANAIRCWRIECAGQDRRSINCRKFVDARGSNPDGPEVSILPTSRSVQRGGSKAQVALVYRYTVWPESCSDSIVSQFGPGRSDNSLKDDEREGAYECVDATDASIKEDIMATVSFGPAEWASENFGSCQLGNQRRTKRLVKVATKMANRPEGSTPNQMEQWGDTKAAYRLFNSPAATFQKIIEPHCTLTKLSCEPGDVKLIICDTTTVDFSNLTKAKGLPRISCGKGHGFFLHTAMMLDAQSHQVDGIAAAEIFHRKKKKIGKVHRNSQRRRADRESAVWGRVIEAVGRPPEEVDWITVCDRGADDIEVMWRAVDQGQGFVIRASRLKRKIITPFETTVPLKDYLETLSPHGTREVKVQATSKSPSRIATVTLRFGEVFIPLSSVVTPWLKEHRPSQPLHVGVVELVELTPPQGVRPIRWVLYTHTTIRTCSQANKIIEQYEQRPVIEDYHKSAKTGCSMEQRREQTSHALENVVGICIVIAIRLLQMKTAAKQTPELPAREFVPLSWIQMLQSIRRIPVRSELTIHQFLRALAGLGGFLGRKCDGEPGWITLWRGFEKLLLMLRGAAVKGIRSG